MGKRKENQTRVEKLCLAHLKMDIPELEKRERKGQPKSLQDWNPLSSAKAFGREIFFLKKRHMIEVCAVMRGVERDLILPPVGH